MAEQTDVPEEIKDYYQTERRERAGIAWLLAFGTLIITVVLGAGIFFAGRWAYRQIAGTDESTTPPSEIAQNEEQEQDSQSQNNQSDEQDSQGGQEDGAVQGNEDENHSEETDESSGAPEESQEDDSESSPVTGSAADEDLPGTGPSGTIVVFAGVSLLGYFIHRFRLWRILGA